jgi:hypothetical protein
LASLEAGFANSYIMNIVVFVIKAINYLTKENLMDLRRYSDNELLTQTKTLIKKEQKLLSAILSHLEEIERRKLYCDWNEPLKLDTLEI